MIQHKILKHMLSLFFVLVLLTVFAMQWNQAEVRRDLPEGNPSAGPEELLRTLEKMPGIKDSQLNENIQPVKIIVPESYLKFSGVK